MFHVFGNIYVETEYRADPTDAQINISENSGFQKIPHPLVANPGKQYGWALSLDEYGPTAFYSMLLAAHESGEKVYIYADSTTYSRMYAALLKALFPNIDYATFKKFFICIKATYDTTTVNFYDSVMDHSLAVKITKARVDELWLQPDTSIVNGLKRLLAIDSDKISLEWRILKLIGQGVVGSIPDTIRNMMRRTAISNSHDALEDWGRVIVDDKRWDVSGATEDSLLDSESTFAACVNFGSLTETWLRLPGAMKADVTDDFLIELLGNIVKVLEDTGDVASAARSANLKVRFEDKTDMQVPENIIRRIRGLFDGGNAAYRLPHSDAAKYNENLIRYVIRLDADQVNALLEGVQW